MHIKRNLHSDISRLNFRCQTENESSREFTWFKTEDSTDITTEVAIKYGRDLVQSVFRNAIRTGLRSAQIHAHVQPFLLPERKTSDNTLLKELPVAS